MRHLLTAALALLLATCAREPATGLTDQQFIDVVVELRRAAAEHTEEPAAYEARRDEILEERGLDDAALRRYVEVRGRDLQRMAEIWSAINERLTEPAEVQ
jgi:hypothetical protein